MPTFFDTRRARARGLLAGVSAALAGHASAAPTFTVTFDDPGGVLSAPAAGIASNLLAAANAWGALLPSNAVINIVVRPNLVGPFASGRSVTSTFVATRLGFNVFAQSAAAKCLGAISPSAPGPDIEITIAQDYAINNLWYDPQPTVRTAPIPPNRTDAVSVFLHELAHAFVFNGWIEGQNGTYPGDYRSTFDEQTVFDGADFTFVGQRASARYGGPVPITFGNPFHLGNAAPGPGSDLIPKLMNGVVFAFATRYRISNLELAIFADAGLRTRPLCPGDANLDGAVNFADLSVLLSNFGQFSLPPFPAVRDGDVNADHRVDFTDLSIVLANFGQVCPGTN